MCIRDRLSSADEVFASSTAGGVMPVCEIAGRPIGTGVRGEWAEKIATEYWRRRSDARYSEEVVYP